MKQSLCNSCGIPETQWRDGKCYACGRGRFCDVTESDIMEQRTYQWLDKHRMLCGAQAKRDDIRETLRSWLRSGRQVPKHVLRYAGLCKEG